MFWNAASTTVALFALSNHHHHHHHATTSTQLFNADDDSQTSSTVTTRKTTLPNRPVPLEKYQSLLEWLQQHQQAILSDKLELRPSAAGGFGAFVTADVAEDEVLFTVPRPACLTMEQALNDPDCGDAFSKLIDKAGPGANTVVLAGYMAKEYLLQDASPWASYFATLPWERGVNQQEHVLFWENEMVEELLSGSLCYGEATGLREEVALATSLMNVMVAKPIRAARGEETEGFVWPWQVQDEASKGPPEGLEEAIKGAFVCLLTRAFQDGEEEEKLVPVLDMLQHSETPNVRHAMRKTDGTVEVRARCAIPADSELFNQYRSEEEESMPYSRFFTRFGFVPGISEPMEHLLQDKSSIFYPSTAEV